MYYSYKDNLESYFYEFYITNNLTLILAVSNLVKVKNVIASIFVKIYRVIHLTDSWKVYISSS